MKERYYRVWVECEEVDIDEDGEERYTKMDLPAGAVGLFSGCPSALRFAKRLYLVGEQLFQATREDPTAAQQGYGETISHAQYEQSRSLLRDALRRHYEKEVSGPGKYECEEPYVPYFDQAALEGFSEVLGSRSGGYVDCVYSVEVMLEDRLIFPEIGTKDHVYLHESNQGFVSELDEAEAKKLASRINETEEDDREAL